MRKLKGMVTIIPVSIILLILLAILGNAYNTSVIPKKIEDLQVRINKLEAITAVQASLLSELEAKSTISIASLQAANDTIRSQVLNNGVIIGGLQEIDIYNMYRLKRFGTLIPAQNQEY